MKRKKNPISRLLLSLGLVAMTGCSDRVPVGETPVTPADEWKVMLSRNGTGGNNVTVALKYGDTISYGTLVPAETAEGTATWLNNEKPKWAESGTVEVITFCPAVSTLPETVDATDNVAYTVDYVTCTPDKKPETFTLTHLMAQLEVHINISDKDAHHHQPTDGIVSLYTTATVDYPNERLTAPDGRNEAFSLGTFTNEKNGTDESENWVNTAQIVIPQTLEVGTQCLSFTAGGRTYTFTPERDITLKAGMKTKLYLGVAFEQAGYVIMEGVTVNDWIEEDPIDVGEMEESE